MAVPLAVAGLLLTTLVRTLATAVVHLMDHAAEEGSFKMLDFWQYVAIAMQGLRIALPAGMILAVGAGPVRSLLHLIPQWLNDGLGIGGGMVVAVGYAMVLNMMATREVWPFFIIGFVLATISQLTLIALGGIGISLALIYLTLSKMGGSANGNGGSSDNGGGSGDPVGDIIDNY